MYLSLYVQGVGVPIPVAADFGAALCRHRGRAGDHLARPPPHPPQSAGVPGQVVRRRRLTRVAGRCDFVAWRPWIGRRGLGYAGVPWPAACLVPTARRRRQADARRRGRIRISRSNAWIVGHSTSCSAAGWSPLRRRRFAPRGLAAAEPLKAGFVYLGPVGDFGWTYQHDVAPQGGRGPFRRRGEDRVRRERPGGAGFRARHRRSRRQGLQDHLHHLVRLHELHAGGGEEISGGDVRALHRLQARRQRLDLQHPLLRGPLRPGRDRRQAVEEPASPAMSARSPCRKSCRA